MGLRVSDRQNLAPSSCRKPGVRLALLVPQPNSGSWSTEPHVPWSPSHTYGESRWMQWTKAGKGGGGRNAAWTQTSPQAREGESYHPDHRALARDTATGIPGAQSGKGTRGEQGKRLLSRGSCTAPALTWALASRKRREPAMDPGQLPQQLGEFWRLEALHCPPHARCVW